jgi:hypothetical protein
MPHSYTLDDIDAESVIKNIRKLKDASDCDVDRVDALHETPPYMILN